MHLLVVALFALGFGRSIGSAVAGQVFKTRDYPIRIVTLAEGLEEPWSLAWLPDGRMLVTEKVGRLRLVSSDGKLSEPVNGLPRIAYGGQGGLLGVVLDPEFVTNKVIYFSFSEPGKGGAGTSVARAVLEDGRLDDMKVIFRQTPKSGGGRHFGGRLVVAPDGTLFATVGERGQRRLAQDTTVNRGQVVRFHPDGRIPEDNPFRDKTGFRPEIWSYGHRNPQGAALHPETGRLWIHEHGARGGDEINISLAGRNYGWPVIAYGRHYSGLKIGEGTRKQGMEQPIYYWDPSIAPSGMAFYTGDKFPKWKGNLFVGALSYQLLARLTLAGEKVTSEERILKGLGERIRDVRQGPDGYIYLLTDSDDGKLLRLVPDNS